MVEVTAESVRASAQQLHQDGIIGETYRQYVFDETDPALDQIIFVSNDPNLPPILCHSDALAKRQTAGFRRPPLPQATQEKLTQLRQDRVQLLLGRLDEGLSQVNVVASLPVIKALRDYDYETRAWSTDLAATHRALWGFGAGNPLALFVEQHGMAGGTLMLSGHDAPRGLWLSPEATNKWMTEEEATQLYELVQRGVADARTSEITPADMEGTRLFHPSSVAGYLGDVASGGIVSH